MGIATTLRKAVGVVLAEAEDRAVNILATTNDAVSEFIGAVFYAASVAAQQVVDIVFDLAGTAVTEAFNVAEAVVTAVLGDELEDYYLSDEPKDYPFDESDAFGSAGATSGTPTVEADKEAD